MSVHRMESVPWPWAPPVASQPTTPPPAPTQTPTSFQTQNTPSTSHPEPSHAAPKGAHNPSNSTPPSSQAKKGRGSRAGAPNYSEKDTEALLDIVADIEPLGANDWALVAQRFGEWCSLNERPEREMESLRNKFDKLANTKKHTGNADCPPNVRRAKEIARAIHGKCAAFSVGDWSSDEETPSERPPTGETEVETPVLDSGKIEVASAGEGTIGTNHMDKPGTLKRAGTPSVGARRNKRKPGATGVKKAKGDDELTAHIMRISRNIDEMTKAVSKQATAIVEMAKQTNPANDAAPKHIVKEQVKAELGNTNKSIVELKSLILSLVNKE